MFQMDLMRNWTVGVLVLEWASWCWSWRPGAGLHPGAEVGVLEWVSWCWSGRQGAGVGALVPEYLQSGLPSSRPPCKYPESEFCLQSCLPSSRPLCKCPESAFYLQSGLPSSRPPCKFPESEFPASFQHRLQNVHVWSLSYEFGQKVHLTQTGYLACGLEKSRPLAKYNLTSCGVRVEGSSGDGLQRPRLDDPQGPHYKSTCFVERNRTSLARECPQNEQQMIIERPLE